MASKGSPTKHDPFSYITVTEDGSRIVNVKEVEGVEIANHLGALKCSYTRHNSAILGTKLKETKKSQGHQPISQPLTQ